MKIETFTVSVEYDDLPRTIDAEFVIIQPCLAVVCVRDHFFTLSYVPPKKKEEEEVKGELLLNSRRKDEEHTIYRWAIHTQADVEGYLMEAVRKIAQGMHPVSLDPLHSALTPHFHLEDCADCEDEDEDEY